MRSITRLMGCVVSLLAGSGVLAVLDAAEIKMHDGQRLAGLIEGYDGKGTVLVYLTSGDKVQLSMRDITSIYFSGRQDHFVRSGDQKIVFAAGGYISVAVEQLRNGDTMDVISQSLGRHAIPVKHVHGLVAMAVEGRAARLAEDMMRPDGIPANPDNAFLDHILDRRGLSYAGVVETFTPIKLEFEHDEQLQQVRIDTFKLAGIRMAEAAKDKAGVFDPIDNLQVAVRTRDRSYLIGQVVSMNPFQWKMRPNFDPQREIEIATSEICQADVLGGRAVFLTNLQPVKTEERAVVAPPQPFQKNANSQGESMNIGGFIYQSGIGVHALSRLTFRLDGKFKTLRADVGIDGRLEKEGSVVFSIQGDGREIYRSPLVRGKIAGGGLAVEIPVEGVKELTLAVDPTEDLDQADVANWGAVRVLR